MSLPCLLQTTQGRKELLDVTFNLDLDTFKDNTTH